MRTCLEISIINHMDGPIGSASAAALADIIPLGRTGDDGRRGVVIPAGSEGSTSVAVSPGRYLVQAVLPSGELVESQVAVAEGETKVVRLEGEVSPHEWLGWQRFSAAQPLLWKRSGPVLEAVHHLDVSLLRAHEGRPMGWWDVGDHFPLWSRVHSIRLPPTHSDARISMFEFRESEGPLTVIVRRDDRLEQVSLPTPWGRIEPAAVQLAVPHDAQLPLSIAVSDPRFGPLLGFIGAGGLTCAYHLLQKDSDEWFLQLLRDKRENPFAAAIAGYLLVVHATERGPRHWHPWIENLAEWYPWLPDGAVLQGWLCLQQGRPYAHWFVEAYSRGLPLMTGTLRMLFDGLLAIEPEDNGQIRAQDDALKQVRKVLARLDPSQPFVTLRYDAREEAPMTDLTLEMFPANEGDCLLLSYRDVDDAARHRHVLIDGGRAGTWRHLKGRLEALPENERELELLVVTHVDRDHIEGVLSMLDDPDCPVRFKDIWFNGYRHLVGDQSFGPVQGEKLTKKLELLPWNVAFEQRAVCVPAVGPLPVRELDGGLRLTLLSPDRRKLDELLPVWEDACRAAGLDPSTGGTAEVAGDDPFGVIDVEAESEAPFKADTAEANGSSIVLLAEYGQRRVLLAADAHPDVLSESLRRLDGGTPVRLDAWKIAHHGSAHNTSRQLLELARCPLYLISTSGAYFKHPNRSAIARIIQHGSPSRIVFNYRSTYTSPWGDDELTGDWNYEAVYCDDTTPGHVLIAF